VNEFVLVEFLFTYAEAQQGTRELRDLGSDFELIVSDLEWELDDSADYDSEQYYRISGKLRATTATAIKLSNSFLAETMRISYIPSSLKDKYRK